MFGPLGVPELIFIFVLALLIFGPRKLPEIGRTIGRGLAEFRKASTDLKRSINTEMIEEEMRQSDPRRVLRDDPPAKGQPDKAQPDKAPPDASKAADPDQASSASEAKPSIPTEAPAGSIARSTSRPATSDTEPSDEAPSDEAPSGEAPSGEAPSGDSQADAKVP